MLYAWQAMNRGLLQLLMAAQNALAACSQQPNLRPAERTLPRPGVVLGALATHRQVLQADNQSRGEHTVSLHCGRDGWEMGQAALVCAPPAGQRAVHRLQLLLLLHCSQHVLHRATTAQNNGITTNQQQRQQRSNTHVVVAAAAVAANLFEALDVEGVEAAQVSLNSVVVHLLAQPRQLLPKPLSDAAFWQAARWRDYNATRPETCGLVRYKRQQTVIDAWRGTKLSCHAPRFTQLHDTCTR